MTGKMLEKEFDPATIADDTYITASDTAAYPLLKAMEIVGDAKLLGISYEPDGREIVSFKIGKLDPKKHSNPRMELSQRWLKNAVLDYTDWQEKWWRELVQNSADAKATKIFLYSNKLETGMYLAGCEDNGRGMTLDILLNKFLVLGGTTKEGGTESSGGFGKAKELLLLPWSGWSIHTRDYAAVGVGDSYTIYHVESGKWVWHKLENEGGKPDFEEPNFTPEYRSGTRLEILFPADNYSPISAAMTYVEKCFMTHIDFTFETNFPEKQVITSIKADLRNGRTVKEIGDKARIHYTKATTKKPRILVRTREGLLMFEETLPYEVEGYVVVELLKPSIELLTSNRDGIKDYSLRNELYEFKNNLAQNTKSALSAKKHEVTEVYKGQTFTAERQKEKEAELLISVGQMLSARVGKEEKFEVDEPNKKMVGDMLEREYKEAEQEAKPNEVVLRGNAATAEIMLSEKMTGQRQLEATLKQLIWTPAYILNNTIGEFRVPSKFRPQSMTPATLRLLKVWTELCKYVLVQLGCSKEWGVGFGFSNDYRAAFWRYEGINWLMLNPMKAEDEIYNPSNESDLKFLYAMAIHECTHLNDNAPNHEETFTTALTKNIALCADGYKKIKKLVAAIPLRGQVEFEKRKVEKAEKSEEKKSKDIPREWGLEWNMRAKKGQRGLLLRNKSVVTWNFDRYDYTDRSTRFVIRALGLEDAAILSFEWDGNSIRLTFRILIKKDTWKHGLYKLLTTAFDPVSSYVNILVNDQEDNKLYEGDWGSFEQEGIDASPRDLSAERRIELISSGSEAIVDAQVDEPDAIGILVSDEKGIAHTLWANSADKAFDYLDALLWANKNGLSKEVDPSTPHLEFEIFSEKKIKNSLKYSLYIVDMESESGAGRQLYAGAYHDLLAYMKRNKRVAAWIDGFFKILGHPYERGLGMKIQVNGVELYHGLAGEVGDAIGVALMK